jgi:hypothetical protein
MKLLFVLTVLLSFLGRAFSDESAPVVSTKYSGPVSPAGIWSDANGNIYGCETSFHSVFKITSGGVKTNFAGTRGTAGVASEGVLAVNALFNSPRAVWGDGQFLYVTDSANNRIRGVSWTTSLVSTVVGGGAGSILTSGEFLGTSVALTLPNAIAGSSNGKVYFADFGHVYVLNTETGLVGMVSFMAGGGDRIGTFAHGALVSLKDIQGLAVDPTNNFLFVADSGNKVVRKMDVATGKSIIFAGRVKKEKFVLPSKPFENGEAAYKAKFGNPSSVWVGDDGTVFIADSLFHTISVVRHDKIYLFAGKWQSGVISNSLMTGPANQVQIEASHIFGDSSKGLLYLSDGTRGGIQQISPLNVNVYAPTATPTVKPTKNPTSQPTSQPTVKPTAQATSASPLISKTDFDQIALPYPTGIWTDASGNVFVADMGDTHQIYKLSVGTGAVTVFAGTDDFPTGKSEDGTATELPLFLPRALWGDADNLYFFEGLFGALRSINFGTNLITTIGGEGDNPVTTSCQSASDVYFDAQSIWGDGRGSLYIQTQSQVLLYSMSHHTIKVIAYSDAGAQKTGEDGKDVPFLDLALPGEQMGLGHMTGDATRNCLYLTEWFGSDWSQIAIVRKLDLGKQTATIFAGVYGQTSTDQYTDGVLATTITFAGDGDGPSGLWVAADGTVFVSDTATASISTINPDTNEITWFAGTWNDGGEDDLLDADDVKNLLQMGGPAKEGKIRPTMLSGNSDLDKLYLVDQWHSGIRMISRLPTTTSLPAGIKSKDKDEIILSAKLVTPLRLLNANAHLRGSV